MNAPTDPKSPKVLQGGGVAFFTIGATFLILGITNHDLLAFIGVGAAFFAIGIGMMARARKVSGDKTSSGEGDQ